MCQKQNDLTAGAQNFLKVYIIYTKRVIDPWGEWGGKNAGGTKIEGIRRYVIENKWIENVRNQALHYIHKKKQDTV